ncbi:MAG: hypothetical protein IJQ31_13585 [Thermoguttaceae bacterium]|nr:hypothetical protein [Thermoguttaceae bacterium]
MKRLISIGLVPLMLLIYWLTAVQRYPYDVAIFIPCSPDALNSYKLFEILNFLMYTLMYPIKTLLFSRLGIPCFLYLDNTPLIRYREEHQLLGQLVIGAEIAIPFAAVGLIAAFLYHLRKADSSFWFLLPFYISIGYGFCWTLNLLYQGIGALIVLLFYLLFGMFWAVVSQGTYRLLEMIPHKPKD